MRIFLAGATGALGKRLGPLLVSDGHHVVGMTKTPGKTSQLEAVGVQPVVADALDRSAVFQAVIDAHPEVVIHQVTALAKLRNLRNWEREFALTNRLRTEGTENLLAAAQQAGARLLVAQSYTGWPNERSGGLRKTEDDPLDSSPPRSMQGTLDAIVRLERIVTSAAGLTGIVLRYGSFYGPGTSTGEGGDIVEMVRQRKFPIIGDGAGVWSFLHVDDAAGATRLAIERGIPGIFNIVDNEPAPVSVWLPELAQAIGAKPPYHLPAWIGRLLVGEGGLLMMTKIRGSSNGKAKRVLGWRPAYPSWRDGFRRGLAPEQGRAVGSASSR